MKRTLLALVAAVPALLATLPVLAVVLVFRAVARGTVWIARAIEPRAVAWEQLMQFEPVIGWKPARNLDTYGLGDDVFHLVTDDEGWRGRTRLEQSEIVVFGDSFAFGHGIDETSFFGNVTGSPAIKAIGANGYNMVQELLWMERLAHRLDGKLVVWMIYHANDLYENLQPNLNRYRMPFVRQRPGTGEWEVVTCHVGPEPWTASAGRDYHARLAEICSETALSDRVFAACEHLLEQGRDVCAAAGGRLAVVTVPDRTQIGPDGVQGLAALTHDREAFDPLLPDRRIGEQCDRLGLPFVALADHLSSAHYRVRDVHWNEQGHRTVADVIRALHARAAAEPAGAQVTAVVAG